MGSEFFRKPSSRLEPKRCGMTSFIRMYLMVFARSSAYQDTSLIISDAEIRGIDGIILRHN